MMRIPLNCALASKRCLLSGIAAFFLTSQVSAQGDLPLPASKTDSVQLVVTKGVGLTPAAGHLWKTASGVPLKYAEVHPYISLQQILKGNAPGVYVQEPSGEPGTG